MQQSVKAVFSPWDTAFECYTVQVHAQVSQHTHVIHTYSIDTHTMTQALVIIDAQAILHRDIHVLYHDTHALTDHSL